MSIIPRTVLLGNYWTCFSRDRSEGARGFDPVIGDCGSRVAHRVFSTLLMSIGETTDTVRFIHG